MRIAIDAMGGDNAPEAVVAGALLAAREYEDELILVGDRDAVARELDKHGSVPKNIRVHHAAGMIRMDEPATSVRRKKDASVCVAADLVKHGEADAIVTAGHTGAAVAATTLKLRMLPGIARPGIGLAMPTLAGESFFIDLGANIEAKAIHLYQHASMGDIFSRYILKKERPTVGILNIGEEETKGTEHIREAHQLLEKSRINFVGNIEGRDIFYGKVDVVVCDGFVGNVVLKVAESITDVISKLLKRELKKNPFTLLGAFLSKSAFHELKRKVNYDEFGGAPLLGVNGSCIISHGKSNPKAIKNAIRVAGEFVRCEVNQHILQETEFLGGEAA